MTNPKPQTLNTHGEREVSQRLLYNGTRLLDLIREVLKLIQEALKLQIIE